MKKSLVSVNKSKTSILGSFSFHFVLGGSVGVLVGGDGWGFRLGGPMGVQDINN